MFDHEDADTDNQPVKVRYSHRIKCPRKYVYTRREAKRVAKRMTARHRTKISHYRCTECGHYHVGNERNQEELRALYENGNAG